MSERAALFFLVFSIRKWSPRQWPEAGKRKYFGAEAASPGGPGGAGVENLVGKCPIVEQTFATPVRNRHSSWFFCALSHVRQNFSSPAPHLHCHHPGRNHRHLSRSPCFSPSATAVLLTAEPMLLKWEREPVCRQPTNFQASHPTQNKMQNPSSPGPASPHDLSPARRISFLTPLPITHSALPPGALEPEALFVWIALPPDSPKALSLAFFHPYSNAASSKQSTLIARVK